MRILESCFVEMFFGRPYDMAFRMLNINGMARNRPLSMPASLGNAKLKLTGLSDVQEEACRAALIAFLERNRLASWELSVNLSDNGPHSWRLDITVVASPELDFQKRSTQLTADKTVDLAQVVDLCLETHYNACMNREATSAREAQTAARKEALVAEPGRTSRGR